MVPVLSPALVAGFLATAVGVLRDEVDATSQAKTGTESNSEAISRLTLELRDIRDKLDKENSAQDHKNQKQDPGGDAQGFAESAQHAAGVANMVAHHSIKMTDHAQAALKKAKNALHDARVDTTGLSEGQKDYLKAAEAHLRTATQKAEYGKLENSKYTGESGDQLQQRLRRLQKELESKEGKGQDGSVSGMRKELKGLRDKLKEKQAKHQGGGTVTYKDGKGRQKSMREMEQDLKEMEDRLKRREENDAKGIKAAEGSMSKDEMKAEIETLKENLDKIEVKEGQSSGGGGGHYVTGQDGSKVWVPDGGVVGNKGIDIDTEMPYGELEPFGREDTAQELTESSITESDEMVDQLERAEVAEEKRAVFRALTRLRGAAITSYDGIARAQTSNIDEYNKSHKWRNTHPMHHLADEEADITKWAFPDTADF